MSIILIFLFFGKFCEVRCSVLYSLRSAFILSVMANIVIYSTPTCGYCRLAKEYFKSINQPYTEYDVSVDHAKAQEMIAKTGQFGVPVIEVDGKVVIGFDKPRIDSYLSQKAA